MKLKEQEAKAKEQERELAIQGKKILETMTPEELQDIEMAAISNLPPEMKKMALEIE